MKKTFIRVFSAFVAIICLVSSGIVANAVELGNIEDLQAKFLPGEGPVEGDYSVDYRYYSPVKENDSVRYPLVIWLHGMGEGSEEGAQVKKNNIAYWASEEFQSRFKPAGGAFILAARSREENGVFWDNSMVAPLRAAIEEFIAENKANIDTTRIYVGGFSMGGKMTYKMAIAYPEMFAAAFPICPAWSPDTEQLEEIANMPIWLTSSKKDPLVNYYLNVTPAWNKLCEVTNVPEKCRFSTLTTVCYADGSKCSSSHHAWFAVNHDMFSSTDGDYPYMSTVNAKGEAVTLKYPDGMISWLTSHTSDYDGRQLSSMGNLDGVFNTDSFVATDLGILDFIMGIFNTLKSMILGV